MPVMVSLLSPPPNVAFGWVVLRKWLALHSWPTNATQSASLRRRDNMQPANEAGSLSPVVILAILSLDWPVGSALNVKIELICSIIPEFLFDYKYFPMGKKILFGNFETSQTLGLIISLSSRSHDILMVFVIM